MSARGEAPSPQSPATSGAFDVGIGFYAIMFTDIVLSTGLRAQYGDASADTFHVAVDELTREVVNRHHGKVVKGLGDGLLAMFRGPTEAVVAGVEIQRRLARRNRNNDVPLRVRIGVTVGEIEVTEDDVFGYPVNEAARLCGAADADGVLVSDIACSLARRAEVSFGSVQEVPITPNAPPTMARPVLVGDEPVALVPLAAALEFSQHGGRFVGRTHEIEQMDEQWARARDGAVELCVVTGEPGLGKTTLVGEFSRHVDGDGGIVLYGRCEERTPAPYQPFVQALSHFVEHCPASELEQLLGPFASEFQRFVPSLGERLPVEPITRLSNPDAERLRVFDAFCLALRSLSSFAPVLLIIDDLHWSGTTTIDLLDRILHDANQSRLMVVLALRGWDPATDPYVDGFLADRHRMAHHVCDIALSGLGPTEVNELAAEWKHQATIDENQTDELWRITAGNPLFVAQVLRSTIGSEVVPEKIPQGVAEVIRRQLERLSGSTRDLLFTAALVGAQFELGVSVAAAAFDQSNALASLEEATLAGIVTPLEGIPLRYEFTHALVQRTIESQFSAARRCQTHAKIAQVLESATMLAPEERLRRLAFHWFEAGELGDPVRGIELGCAAAQSSIEHLAIIEAIEQLERVETLRRLAPDPRRDAEVAVLWAEAKCIGARPDARDAQLRAVGLAEAVGDARLLARAALANSRGYFSIYGGIDDDRIHALEAALKLCDADDLATQAMLLSRLEIELTFDTTGRRDIAKIDEALKIARQLDDPVILASVLRNRQYVLGGPQYCDVRVREVHEMREIARKTGDKALEIHACRLMCATATEIADVHEIDQCLERLRELNDEVDLVVSKWELASVRTSRTILAGHLKEAARMVKEAFALGSEAWQPDAYVFTGAQLMHLNYLRGRLPEVMSTYLEMTPSEITKPLSAWVARQLHVAGLVDEATQWWEKSLAMGLEQQMGVGVQAGLVLNAWAYMASNVEGNREILVDVRERLAPYSERLFNQLAPDQPGHHFLGLIADALDEGEVADEHFSSSISLLQRINAPVMIAVSQVAWARSLRRRGETAKAAELALAAQVAANEAGATLIVQQSTELLGGLV